MLSEIRQSQKDKFCMIPFIWGTQSSQIHTMGVAKGWEEGDWEVSLKRVQGTNGGEQCGCIYATELYTQKMVNMVTFMLCVLYHNRKLYRFIDLKPLSEARDWTHILMDASQVRYR